LVPGRNRPWTDESESEVDPDADAGAGDGFVATTVTTAVVASVGERGRPQAEQLGLAGEFSVPQARQVVIGRRH